MRFGLFPTSNKQDWRSPAQASSAGRTNDVGLSPPFDVNTPGPRQPKTPKAPHSVMPSITRIRSNPSVSPYPPVKYEWELEE